MRIYKGAGLLSVISLPCTSIYKQDLLFSTGIDAEHQWFGSGGSVVAGVALACGTISLATHQWADTECVSPH